MLPFGIDHVFQFWKFFYKDRVARLISFKHFVRFKKIFDANSFLMLLFEEEALKLAKEQIA